MEQARIDGLVGRILNSVHFNVNLIFYVITWFCYDGHHCCVCVSFSKKRKKKKKKGKNFDKSYIHTYFVEVIVYHSVCIHIAFFSVIVLPKLSRFHLLIYRHI